MKLNIARIFFFTLIAGLCSCSYFEYKAKGFSSPSRFDQSLPAGDGRLQVVEGNIPSPYDSICHINVNRRHLLLGKTYASSGSIVNIEGLSLLFTAKHSAGTKWYSVPHSIWLECGVGTMKKQKPQYAAMLSKPLSTFTPSLTSFDDFAVVFMQNQDSVPMSSFFLPTREELKNLAVGDDIYISGYPGRVSGNRLTVLKTKIDCHERASHETCHIGKKQNSLGTKVYYTSKDTGYGLSGGPIWIVRENGDRVIIGVHGFGNRFQKAQSGGFILNRSTLDQVTDWLKSSIEHQYR